MANPRPVDVGQRSIETATRNDERQYGQSAMGGLYLTAAGHNQGQLFTDMPWHPRGPFDQLEATGQTEIQDSIEVFVDANIDIGQVQLSMDMYGTQTMQDVDDDETPESVTITAMSLGPQQQATGPTTITAGPQVVNLVLYQGDDFYLDLTVTNPDTTPFDLTGYTPTSQIKDQVGGSVLASFTCTIGGNIVHLHLPAVQSALLTSNGVWDCEITSATGLITTLVAGTVKVTADVTEP